MSTVATPNMGTGLPPLAASPISRAIDRWIFVFMAAFFIAITLVGFIPSSLEKIAAVEAGQRPPFPFVMHLHAVLMGSFLLLLLAQATLVATGRQAYHQKLGLVAVVLVPALVVVGLLLIPTAYGTVWNAMQAAPDPVKPEIQLVLRELDNIMLLQFRVGLLFPIFVAISLLSRKTDSSLHKRMIFLAVVVALPAAIDRMTWLPTTLPGHPISSDLYTLLAVSPMFVWDVIRTRKVHKAYVIWLAIFIPASIVVYSLWSTDWWHATAPRLVGL